MIGTGLTLYGTFAISIMMGPGPGFLTLLVGFALMIYFPYYAKTALSKNNAMPSIWHAIYIMVFNTLLIPLAIWQLILAYKLNQYYQRSDAEKAA